MEKRLWDKYFLKMRILVYLQLALIIYSGLAVYTMWRNNLPLSLLMLVSITGAVLSIYLIIKSAADSWRLEQSMKQLNQLTSFGKS